MRQSPNLVELNQVGQIEYHMPVAASDGTRSHPDAGSVPPVDRGNRGVESPPAVFYAWRAKKEKEYHFFLCVCERKVLLAYYTIIQY